MEEKSSKLLSALGQVALAIISGITGAFATSAIAPTPPQPPVREVAVVPTRDSKATDFLISRRGNLELPAGSPPEGTYSIYFRSYGEEVKVNVRVPDYLIIGAPTSEGQEVEGNPEGSPAGPRVMLEYAPSSESAPLKLELNREYMRSLLAELNVDEGVYKHMESVDEVRIVRTGERPTITNESEE